MKSIVDTAVLAANKVVMVAFEVDPWTGGVEFNVGGQHFTASTLPLSFLEEIAKTRLELYANIRLYSMPCRDGRFVPNRSAPEWHREHKVIMGRLVSIMDDITSQAPKWDEALRASARDMAGTFWKERHGDTMPPPSYLLMAENTAWASIPSKTDIVGSFRVPVRYGMHSFSCMAGGLGTAFKQLISGDDLVEAAWLTVDELLVNPYRTFFEKMEKEASPERANERLDYKLRRMAREASRFLNVELVGDDASVVAAKKISDMMRGEGACCVDWKKARVLAIEASESAKKFTSVAGVMAEEW